MKQRNFDQFTQAVILNASQMAYLEDAQNTQSMLIKFNELFKHFIKPDHFVYLHEEINGLKNYVDLQKIRYGNRFNIAFPQENTYDDILINHLEIIDYFDHVLNNALIQYEKSINITILIVRDSDIKLRIVLDADNVIEEFNIVLMEEGRIGV